MSNITIMASDTGPHTAFSKWIVSHCNQNSMVLEVGAGTGNQKYASLIRQQVNYLVGLDPDPTVISNQQLDEKYQLTLEEFAKDHQQLARFDIIYAYCVAEHLEQPLEFLTGCRKLLRTGGQLFIYTPNLWHYFGIATKVSAVLGFEDWILARLFGAQKRDDYHFPTYYRINSISTIKNYLERTRYTEVEFHVFDNPNIFQGYLPKPLRGIPTLWSKMVYIVRLAPFMGTLMFKATA